MCCTASSKLKGRARRSSYAIAVQLGDPRPVGRGVERTEARGTPLRVSGRRVLIRRPRQNPHSVRQSWRAVVHASGDQITHRQDPSVESCIRVSSGLSELGPDVWNPEGVKVLGTPVGSRAFVDEVINKRLREEHNLWDAIPWSPTSRQRGKYSSNAPARDATTSSGRCPHRNPQSTPNGMMTG